jgi:ATP/ADP translocase
LAERADKSSSLLTVVAIAAVATLIAQHIAGKATRDALFLTYFPIERLPLAMMISAILSIAGVLLMSRLLARFGPARLIPTIFALSAALLLLQWRLIDSEPRIAAAILYLQVSAINSLLISGFWSVINERFDPHSAKKVIARLVAASTFGGLAGGVAAKVVSDAADTHAILLMLALMHVFCGIAVFWIGRGESKPQADKPIRLFEPLKSSSLIRAMAFLALTVATLAAVLDYILKSEAVATLGEDQLISFFSYFYVGVGLGTFLLQAAVGDRALRWLGLGGTMIAWPLAILVTGGFALVMRSLITVTLLRGSATLLYNSFFRSGFEVLYTPIPAEQKRTGKVMIDVGADRAGDLTGGLVVMGILLIPAFTESLLLIVALCLAAVCAVLILLLQRRYSGQLAENLASGQLDVGDVEAVDRTTAKTLAETQLAIDRGSLLREIEEYRRRRPAKDAASRTSSDESDSGARPQRIADPLLESVADLRSGDDARIRRALASRDMAAELVPHAVALLRNEGLVPDALRALRPAATRSAGVLVDMLLDPMQSARIRRRIPIVLGYSQSPLAVVGLLATLDDRDWNVRFRAAQGLDHIARHARRPKIDSDRLRRAIEAEVSALGGRAAAGEPAAARRLELVFLLIGIGDNPDTVDLCWRALQSDDRWLKGTAVEYLENRLPAELWQRLLPHLDLAAAAGAEPRSGKDEDPEKALRAAADKLKHVRRLGDHVAETTGGTVSEDD